MYDRWICTLSILTVYFQLDYFANTAANAIARLTEVKSLSVFFHVLQQQRTITEDFRVRSFPQLLVFTGFAPYFIEITRRILNRRDKQEIKLKGRMYFVRFAKNVKEHVSSKLNSNGQGIKFALNSRDSFS